MSKPVSNPLVEVFVSARCTDLLRETQHCQASAKKSAEELRDLARKRSKKWGREWEKHGEPFRSAEGDACSAWGDVAELMDDVARGTRIDQHEWKILNTALRLEKRLAARKKP